MSTSPSLGVEFIMPRSFPELGFKILDPAECIEEESLPGYTPELYYPVHIGEIFNARYQAFCKLGYETILRFGSLEIYSENCLSFALSTYG